MSDIIRETGKRCRNWGRWGPDDERGTLNYITPEAIVEAARLVRRGAVFSLAIPFDAKGPQIDQPRRFNPIHRMMITGPDCTTGAIRFPGGIGFSDDMVIMPLQCATQWDALSHCFEDGRMYNGYDANEVSSRGAKRNGIDKVASGVAARGVLLDMPRAKGVKWLEPGYAISAGDLDAAVAAQRVTIRSGDALLVRTGHMTLCKDRGGWGSYAGGDAPGLSFHTADWIHQHQIAAVASDTWGMEVRPNEIADSFQPLHQVCIPNMGLTIGEIFFLDDLAEDCARDGVYEFFFVAPPLPITGAVGSPINPLAIK
ncbi:MAG: cyclase [Acidobacteria bacterium]|nr:MAG: cyclase [Acidobacteriota bacterium]PYQ83264.1 MAG: cyclase [Acidobacteriota bacterium]PYQ91296.1 MAG: cyclase [Acidobacteriota bacterium]PYR12842.1 MAG: cyclase [Acidobacteriota bacterium]